jgi:hypothetical protein
VAKNDGAIIGLSDTKLTHQSLPNFLHLPRGNALYPYPKMKLLFVIE